MCAHAKLEIQGFDKSAGSGAAFQGGHTHAGMLNSAHWLLKNETQTLKQLLEDNPSYELRFIGHSLGAGSRLHQNISSLSAFDNVACRRLWSKF